MSKVFIVQEPLMKNGDGVVGPRFDLRPLERYGEIVMILAWSDMRPPVDEARVWRKICDCLEKHHYTSDDYLVPTGHPAAIAMAALAAADVSRTGPLRMLVWDGKFRKYDLLTLTPESR